MKENGMVRTVLVDSSEKAHHKKSGELKINPRDGAAPDESGALIAKRAHNLLAVGPGKQLAYLLLA